MKKLLTITCVLLSALLILSATACGGKEDQPKDTTPDTAITTQDDTETPTEAPTEMPTEAPTEPETQPETAPETTADSGEEETDVNPYTTPVRVGTSYDGKTPSYDGRFEHPYESFSTIYGEYYSIQEAVDDLEGIGGNIALLNFGDIGMCLNVVIPNDDCFYRIAYNWNNCDFTFNYGYTYDDGSGGYAYYSQLYNLDVIGGLDGTHIFCWGANDELEQGYYLMTAKTGPVGEDERHYIYELVCPVEDVWPGLPQGETYFEN